MIILILATIWIYTSEATKKWLKAFVKHEIMKVVIKISNLFMSVFAKFTDYNKMGIHKEVIIHKHAVDDVKPNKNDPEDIDRFVLVSADTVTK